MTAGEEPIQAAPITGDAAPRMQLVVQAGSEDEIRIRCRRIVTLLGSRDQCKVTLRHPQVSGVHVAIVNDGSRILAVDLTTKHGTLLNGLKMEHERLSSGDVLTIHPWEFRLEIEQPTHNGGGDVYPFGLEPGSHGLALEHMATGRILRPIRDLCIMGRRAGCDVVITDNRVSRVHALLLNQFGHPAIFDLLSRNGTFVNDTPVQFHLLKQDDVITLGESTFAVRLVASSAAERTAKDNKPAETTAEEKPEDLVSDLVDIQKTEASQRWRIAESRRTGIDRTEKVARKA